MRIISSASGSSCWKGLDYYKLNKVKNIKQNNEWEYESKVCGTEEYKENEYENAIKFINKISKKELVEELIYIFDYAPEWVYDDLVKKKDIDG